MLKALALVAALLCCGCFAHSHPKQNDSANANANARSILLGEWCGESDNNKTGTYVTWWVNRYRDGRYKTDITEYSPEGEAISWSEYGIWGVTSPVYFTAMRSLEQQRQLVPTDLSDPTYYDAYKIIALTEQTFTYESFASGQRFTQKRQCDAGD